MKKDSLWLPVKEASEFLRVDAKTLETLLEGGHLKPGHHWKSSSDPEQLPWKPKVIYSMSCCKEILKSWQDDYASFDQLAA